MKQPPRKSEQAMIKFLNTQSLSHFLGSMIKRESKLIANRIFVPSAAQNKVAKNGILLTCIILITYKFLNG